MINGTSMASPQRRRVARLCCSPPPRPPTGASPRPQLRRAIYTSAKPIAGHLGRRSGQRQLDVVGAWKLLDEADRDPQVHLRRPRSAPRSQRRLRDPEPGAGVYNRCAAGRRRPEGRPTKTYTVKLTRNSGPNKTIKHKLIWEGNDGTFSSVATVDLPLKKTVSVVVTAKPKVGAHSAALRVDDPATSVVDFEVLNTVIVGNDLVKPAYAFEAEGTVDRNSSNSYFINVPAGATGAAGEPVRHRHRLADAVQTITPAGVPVESTLQPGVLHQLLRRDGTCKPQERSYENPAPGIWEIEVESRRTSPALANPYELTVRAQGTAVSPAVVQLPSVTKGQPTPVKWTVKNEFGPIVVTGQGGPLQQCGADPAEHQATARR